LLRPASHSELPRSTRPASLLVGPRARGTRLRSLSSHAHVRSMHRALPHLMSCSQGRKSRGGNTSLAEAGCAPPARAARCRRRLEDGRGRTEEPPRSAPRVDRPVTASPGVRPILFERRSTDTSCFTRHFPPRQAADTDSTQPAWRRGADNTTFELTLRRVQVIGPFAAAHRTAQDYSAAGHIQSRVEALHRAATPRRPCAVAMAGASGGEPVRRQPAGDDSPSAAPLPQRPRGQKGCDRVVHLSYCKFAAKTGQ
jgi:hypothetical protein